MSNDEQTMKAFLADIGSFSLWPTERRDELLAVMARMTHEQVGRATIAHFVEQFRAAAMAGDVKLEALRGARDETLSELERLVREVREAGGVIPPAMQARLDAVRRDRGNSPL